VLCLLFLAAEFRWMMQLPPPPVSNDASFESRTEAADGAASILCTANILALAYVSIAYAAKIHPTISLPDGYYLDLWPLQNGVNLALAATVSRALTPFLLPSGRDENEGGKSIRTAALALVGLALFDAVSTLGTVTQVANAATTAEAVSTSMSTATSGSSVMETVARSRLESWGPGLLEIVLGHGDASKVTEALGLGDVVFPSILVAWGFVADGAGSNEVAGESDGSTHTSGDGGGDDVLPRSAPGPFVVGYATASVAGYVLGSFATEIVGTFGLLGDRSGLPALVFLVPCMLGAVTLTALARDELDEVWGIGQ